MTVYRTKINGHSQVENDVKVDEKKTIQRAR